MAKKKGNIFQEIKKMCDEAEAAGIELWKLSIGQPTGPALWSARKAAAKAILSKEESMHEYQDNGSPGCPNFAERFIHRHIRGHIPGVKLGKGISYLPTPGTKAMLGLIPMASGGIGGDKLIVGTHTRPGYPTPAVWARYLNQSQYYLKTDPDNAFLFSLDDVDPRTNVLMINYPHNPSGQVMPESWARRLCEFCRERSIDLFNDAAYAMLSEEGVTLSEVAVDYPGLRWAEAFSASKIGNFTGWRIGAMVGSEDFISDIARVKGETDSGFNAALATGILHAVENDQEGIEKIRMFYRENIEHLVGIMLAAGMKLAVRPRAGFFTLWETPSEAFGRDVQSAEHFNQMMIKETGVVGVHFPPYIRYAVVASVRKKDFTKAIKEAFKKANVKH